MKKIFGKSLGAILCSVIAISMFTISGKAETEIKDKYLGIQLYSVMDAMIKDPKGSIVRLTDMGYNVCELVQWGGDTKVFGLPAEEFKAFCDQKGMEIISTHSGIQEDPAKEEEIFKRWRQLFETQKACGGKYFVIPGYGVDFNVKDVQKMCDYFNRVGKLASEYGLKLGYHNHSHEYNKLKDSDQVMWEYLVENTDPEYVFFELDVYWCAMAKKDPVGYLKKYPDRIQMLHIKDDFVIGASGKLDFEAIFKEFYKNGMTDYVVEIETPGYIRDKKNPDGSKYTQEQVMNEVFKAARKSADYLKISGFPKDK